MQTFLLMPIDEEHRVFSLLCGCDLCLYVYIVTRTYNYSGKYYLSNGLFSFLKLYASYTYACPSHCFAISFFPNTHSTLYVIKAMVVHIHPSFLREGVIDDKQYPICSCILQNHSCSNSLTGNY
jgi:hypothetical protein